MKNNTSNNLSGRTPLNFLKNNILLIFFIFLAIFFSATSGDSLGNIARDVSSRFFRNIFLILALILPIMAGVGLNFGVILGAMSSQIAIVLMMTLGLHKTDLAYAYWTVLTIIISAFCGYLLALLFNKTKKQEMVAGLLVGFFAQGLYMLIFMIILGTIIKVSDPSLVAIPGAPIKSSIDLPNNMYAAVDKALTMPYYYIAIIAYLALMVFIIIKIVQDHRVKENRDKKIFIDVIKVVLTTGVFVFFMLNNTISDTLKNTSMPMLTCLISILMMLFIWRLMRTKLGQDFNSVRNDMSISSSVGINVDRIRMTAIILSTIMAGLGQMIYLQNLGTLNTYQMHLTVAPFAIAAILMGGATVKRASIKNAIIGNILFQIIYGSAPNATKMLLGNPQIGEYFRMFLCYGVIALAIVIYAVKEVNAAKKSLVEEA